MEQIRERERNLGWKERCDDISALCDADVFFAVDYWAQEAGFYGDFHPESSVWLDGDWLGGGAGLGVRERRSAAGVCNGWAGAVLRPLRSDDRGRSFLPELRAAAVIRASSKPSINPQPVAAGCAPNKLLVEIQTCAAIREIRSNDKALSETQPFAISRATIKPTAGTQPPPTLSREKACACASGISHPLLRDAKDGAPTRARIVLLSGKAVGILSAEALRIPSGQAGASRISADAGVC